MNCILQCGAKSVVGFAPFFLVCIRCLLTELSRLPYRVPQRSLLRNVVAKLSSARRMTIIGKSALWIEIIEPQGRLNERPSRLIR